MWKSSERYRRQQGHPVYERPMRRTVIDAPEESVIEAEYHNLSATLQLAPIWEQPKAKLGPKTNWVKRITISWNYVLTSMRKTVEAHVACGDVLIQAKKDLGDDGFTDMLRSGDLPFKAHKAWALYHIAEIAFEIQRRLGLALKPNAFEDAPQIARYAIIKVKIGQTRASMTSEKNRL